MTAYEKFLELKEENKKLRKELAIHGDEGLDIIHELENENKNLKKQIDYIRSGEYYNQLRFENEMLQQVVDTNGVPSEVYDYIDCTHRNTELLEEKENLIKYLENKYVTIKEYLELYPNLRNEPHIRECIGKKQAIYEILEKVKSGKHE